MHKLIAILFVMSLAAPGPGLAQSKSPKIIEGSVFGFSDGSQEALSVVLIELRPVAPLKGKDRRPAPDLVGVGVTDGDGKFTVIDLLSKSRKQSYPLLVNWTYHAKVVAPGHYVFNGIVSYYGEDEPWDFMLEAKVTDVVDDSGVITPEERALQRGATRRGSQ